MFRDESSHVISKAKKKKSLPSIDRTAPSRANAVPTPTTVQRSPTESDSSTSPDQLSWTPVALSASTASPRRQSGPVVSLRSWSPAQSPPTQLLSHAHFDERGKHDSNEQPGKSPPINASEPISYSLTPSFQDRGVNLFVARYITVVSMPSDQGPPSFDPMSPDTSGATEREPNSPPI